MKKLLFLGMLLLTAQLPCFAQTGSYYFFWMLNPVKDPGNQPALDLMLINYGIKTDGDSGISQIRAGAVWKNQALGLSKRDSHGNLILWGGQTQNGGWDSIGKRWNGYMVITLSYEYNSDGNPEKGNMRIYINDTLTEKGSLAFSYNATKKPVEVIMYDTAVRINGRDTAVAVKIRDVLTYDGSNKLAHRIATISYLIPAIPFTSKMYNRTYAYNGNTLTRIDSSTYEPGRLNEKYVTEFSAGGSATRYERYSYNSVSQTWNLYGVDSFTYYAPKKISAVSSTSYQFLSGISTLRKKSRMSFEYTAISGDTLVQNLYSDTFDLSNGALMREVKLTPLYNASNLAYEMDQYKWTGNAYESSHSSRVIYNGVFAILPPPVASPPSVTLGTNPSLCKTGTAAYLTYSNLVNNPTTYSINWSAPALAEGFVAVSGATLSSGTVAITVPSGADTGTYSGTMTVSNGLSSPAYPFSITVFPELPELLISNDTVFVPAGDTLVAIPFTASGDLTGVKYNIYWYSSSLPVLLNQPVSGSSVSYTLPANTSPGTYIGSLFVSNNGCEAFVDTLFVTVQGSVGLAELRGNNALTIYPHPVKETAEIVLTGTTAGKDALFSIYDTTGKLKLSTDIQNGRSTLNCSDFCAGLYFYTLHADGKTIATGKLVIE